MLTYSLVIYGLVMKLYNEKKIGKRNKNFKIGK